MIITEYYDNTNKLLKRQKGVPRLVKTFDKNSLDATTIHISLVSVFGWYKKFFSKINGRWIGKLVYSDGMWKRNILLKKSKYVKMAIETVENNEAEESIKKEMDDIMNEANDIIRWCYMYDKNDKKYWMNIYQGEGKYILIVKDYKIQGGISGSIMTQGEIARNMKRIPANVSNIAWRRAVIKNIEKKIGMNYSLIEVNCYCNKFYLCNNNDRQSIDTIESVVVDLNGRMSHEMEIIA